MATIVDSLIVTLGLDSKDFERGQKKTQEAFDKTRKDADKTAKELEHAGKQAAQFFTKVRNEALAFFAVLAVGSGLKSFVSDTIASASSLYRMSSNLGMSAKDLSEWQLAAKNAGGTAEGMTAQIRSAADDIAKYKSGFGSETLKWFFNAGGTPDDLRSANSLLMKKADIIKSLYDVDPNQARLVAGMMGVSDEGAFNLLKGGSASASEKLKAQAALAEEMQRLAERSEALRKKLDALSNRFDAIKLRVFEVLMPYLERIGNWLTDHKEDIAKWFDSATKKIIEFAKELNKGVQAVGGWQTVLVALLALKVVSFAADMIGLAAALGRVGGALGLIGALGAGALKILGPLGLLMHSEDLNKGEEDALNRQRSNTLPSSTKSTADRRAYLLGRLRQDGYTDAQAAGIIGSLMQESGLNPNAINQKSGAIGIAQWLSKDRVSGFAKRYGHGLDKSTFGEQVEYMLWELHSSEKRAGDLLRRAPNASTAAQIHAWEYERPGVAEANIDQRTKYAQSVLAAIGSAGAMATAKMPMGASAAMPTMRYGGHPNSTVSSETNIGAINIQTAATDADGIAKDIGNGIKRHAFGWQSNTGVD